MASKQLEVCPSTSTQSRVFREATPTVEFDAVLVLLPTFQVEQQGMERPERKWFKCLSKAVRPGLLQHRRSDRVASACEGCSALVVYPVVYPLQSTLKSSSSVRRPTEVNPLLAVSADDCTSPSAERIGLFGGIRGANRPASFWRRLWRNSENTCPAFSLKKIKRRPR